MGLLKLASSSSLGSTQPQQSRDGEIVQSTALKKKVGQICQLLKTTPRMSLQQMQQMEQAMLDLNELLDLLVEDPDRISVAKNAARRHGPAADVSLKATAAAKSTDEHTHFHEKYTQFGRIPKKFIWAYYSQRCPSAFSPARIELIENCDPSAVRKILEFDTGCGPTTPVPPRCHERKVLSMALTKAHESLGNRVTEGWASKAISGDGGIQWERFGVYRWAGDAQTTIQCFGKTVESHEFPDGYTKMFKDGGKIQKNWKDASAYIELQMTDFNLATMNWDKARFSLLTSTFFKGVVDTVAKEVEKTNEEESKKRVSIGDDVAQACKRRRRKAPATAPAKASV